VAVEEGVEVAVVWVLGLLELVVLEDPVSLS
jgi:hypothetical protein